MTLRIMFDSSQTVVVDGEVPADLLIGSDAAWVVVEGKTMRVGFPRSRVVAIVEDLRPLVGAQMAPAAMGDDRERHASLIDHLAQLEGQVERLDARVDAVRRHFGGVVDGLLRKVGANGSTDPHSLDHRVAELERQAKTAGQGPSATKNGSPVESASHSAKGAP